MENTRSEETGPIVTNFMYGSQQVRTVVIDGEPWFVAKDVCDVLGLDNVPQATSRLDADERNTIILSDGIRRGNPNRVIISEAGLYVLILSSEKAEAKTFKRWITHEVIPAIRKTGSYSDGGGEHRLVGLAIMPYVEVCL